MSRQQWVPHHIEACTCYWCNEGNNPSLCACNSCASARSKAENAEAARERARIVETALNLPVGSPNRNPDEARIEAEEKKSKSVEETTERLKGNYRTRSIPSLQTLESVITGIQKKGRRQRARRKALAATIRGLTAVLVIVLIVYFAYVGSGFATETNSSRQSFWSVVAQRTEQFPGGVKTGLLTVKRNVLGLFSAKSDGSGTVSGGTVATPGQAGVPTPTPVRGIVIPPTPTATPKVSAPTPTPDISAALQQLRVYMLSLINADRAKAGLAPVKLGTNSAAQQHADDMLANFYLGHIDGGGMKPYMRYTLAGGLGADGENAAYAGTQDPNDHANYVSLDPKAELAQLEYEMMYDDASSNWGHRDNILEAQHQYVNIGIAYNRTRLALSQQFEEDYVNFSRPPTLASGTLALAGTLDPSVGALESIDIYYDPPPTAYTHTQLLSQPRSYSIGNTSQPLVHIIPPAPPGSFYPSLQPSDVVATSWTGGGTFQVAANLGNSVSSPGVYTVLLWSDQGKFSLTTIALFVGVAGVAAPTAPAVPTPAPTATATKTPTPTPSPVVVAVPTTSQPPIAAVYTSDKYWYSINAPLGWTVNSADDANVALADKATASTVVIAVKAIDPNLYPSLSAYIAANQPQPATGWTNFAVLNQKRVRTDQPIQSQEFTYTYVQSSQAYQVTADWYVLGRYFVTVSATATLQEWQNAEVLNAVRGALVSFQPAAWVDPAVGYSVSYPPSWRVATAPGYIFGADESVTGTMRLNVKVASATGFHSVAEYGANQTVAGATILSRDAVYVGSVMRGYRINYLISKSGGKSESGSVYFVLSGNNGISFALSNLSTNWANDLPTVNDIILRIAVVGSP